MKVQVKNCGGPLVCKICAMQWAQEYHNGGMDGFATDYMNHAKKLMLEELNDQKGTDRECRQRHETSGS